MRMYAQKCKPDVTYNEATDNDNYVNSLKANNRNCTKDTWIHAASVIWAIVLTVVVTYLLTQHFIHHGETKQRSNKDKQVQDNKLDNVETKLREFGEELVELKKEAHFMDNNFSANLDNLTKVQMEIGEMLDKQKRDHNITHHHLSERLDAVNMDVANLTNVQMKFAIMINRVENELHIRHINVTTKLDTAMAELTAMAIIQRNNFDEHIDKTHRDLNNKLEELIQLLNPVAFGLQHTANSGIALAASRPACCVSFLAAIIIVLMVN